MRQTKKEKRSPLQKKGRKTPREWEFPGPSSYGPAWIKHIKKYWAKDMADLALHRRKK